MSEKYSNNDLNDIVDREGLGYAVQDYLDAERIEDEDAYDLWIEAKRALDALQRFLWEHDTREDSTRWL